MKDRITYRISELHKNIGSNDRMFADDLERIERDYQQMADFFMTGQPDPQIERVYNDIDVRLNRLTARYTLAKLCNDAPLYKRMLDILKGDTVLDIQQIQDEMEKYEIDITMLELESSESLKEQKRQEIANGQNNMRQRIFAKLLLSPLWTAETAELFKDLMLSPTVDRIAVEMMVTAVLLSCMNIFDEHKYGLLYKLHKQSNETAIQQKAAVAVILLSRFCSNERLQLPQQNDIDLKDYPIDDALLLSTQKMMVYTIDSESIGKRIETELMPEIIKSSDISIKNGKIVEKPLDKIEDIINPNKDEESIEKIEEAVRRMHAMQKDGADIFYAGFSHVKRHPFFNNPIHWFYPFTRQHPALGTLRLDAAGEKILNNLINKTPFCESDKYSFVLMMGQVFSQLPANIKEMLSNEQAELALAGSYTRFEPAILERRKYLQDLYRFFKLSPFAQKIYNPFGSNDMMFMESYIEAKAITSDETVKSLLQFLRSIGKLDTAMVLMNLWEPTDLKMRIFSVFLMMENNQNYVALDEILKLIEEYPDNLQIIYGLAKCLWRTDSRKIVAQYKDKITNSLLALHFKNENDKPTHNLLAKMYIISDEHDKALREIKSLYETDSVEPDLLLVTAYIYFLRDKQAIAIQFLNAYKQHIIGKNDDERFAASDIADNVLLDYLKPLYGKDLPKIADDIIDHIIATS